MSAAQSQTQRREPRLTGAGDQPGGAAPGAPQRNEAGLGSLAAKLLSEAKARALDPDRRAPTAPNPASAAPSQSRAAIDARLQVQNTAPQSAPRAVQAPRSPADQLRSVNQAINRARQPQPQPAQATARPQQRSQLRPVPPDDEADFPGPLAPEGQEGGSALSALDWPGRGNAAAPRPVRGSVLDARDTISARHYVQSLNSRLRDEKAAHMRNAMSQVEKEEINALIRLLARLRGRHAVLLLELGKTDKPLKGDIFSELHAIRQQIEEIEAGLELFKSSILEGAITVRGVRAEEM